VRRVSTKEDGPVLLVGHSWSGAVITEADNHPRSADDRIAAAAPDLAVAQRLAGCFDRPLGEGRGRVLRWRSFPAGCEIATRVPPPRPGARIVRRRESK